jgi:hypothetical protein
MSIIEQEKVVLVLPFRSTSYGHQCNELQHAQP